MLINSILLQLSLLLMHEAAILDAKVGVGGVHPTFRFGNTTSGSVPVEIFNWELGMSDFPVEMERTITESDSFSVNTEKPSTDVNIRIWERLEHGTV